MRAITEPLRKCDLILIEGGEKTDKEMPKIILVKVIKKKIDVHKQWWSHVGARGPRPL